MKRLLITNGCGNVEFQNSGEVQRDNSPSLFNLRYLGVWIGAIVLSFFCISGTAQSQISFTLTKSNNAPVPVASGQPFTYNLTYSWSGGAPGTIYIVDNVPASLDVISALPGNPVSVISGNVVTFTLTGLTLPSGSGTVQVNVRFTPGITCAGVKACNKASITDNPNAGNAVFSNEDCVTSAQPTNKWQFEKEWIAGCAVDDDVIFRIKIVNPAGSDIGGVNLTNINMSDFVPPGAIVTGVYGYWTGISGTTLTGGPTTFYVSPWTVWYYAYIKVKFPSPTFTAGQTVINKGEMRFNTPCSPNFITWSDTAKITLCQGVTQGSLGKYLSLAMYFPNNPSWYPVFSPGCCGTYSLYYTNNGTLAQNNFVMEDNIPHTLDLNSITSYVPPADTVTLQVYCWSGGTCSTIPCTTAVYQTSGNFVMSGLPANVCKVKWSHSAPIAVSQYLYNYLDVCVRTTDYATGAPVLTGQNIINTATAVATGLPLITVTHTKVVDVTQPKVIATKMFIGSCSNTCQVLPNGPFQPGDIVRFRMAVANIGNANATLCTITDNLPAGLSYVGNETYFYGTFNWMANIYNPPCCSLAVAVPPNVGGTLTKPTLGQTNLTWTFPVLPGRCDGQVDYFIIDFDVKISDAPPAPPGQYVNTFAISASNVASVPSNQAYLTVNATSQVQVIKEVRKQGTGGSGGPWSFSTTLPAGGLAEFRLTVKNTGNTPLSNLCLLDIMPWTGDIKVLPAYTSRGSVFNLPYDPANGSLALSPVGFPATYNSVGLLASQNPRRSLVCGGFCGVVDPAGSTAGIFGAAPLQTYSFKITANSGVNLAPGASLTAIVPVKIPATNVKPQDHACNSFGIQAVPVGIPSVCLSAESNTACIQIADPPPCFRLLEQRLNCVGQNANGNWIYQLQFNITNISGQNGTLQIIPSAGTVSSITPTSLLNGVPTNVSAMFMSPSAGGGICFDIVLLGQNKQKICDTTICMEYKPCPEPCPCPFKMVIDNNALTQASGNQVWLNSVISIFGTNITKIKASIVSAVVTQNCLFGGSTTYNSAATISSSTFNPITAIGFGTPEVTWTNMLCPQIVGKNLGMYLNIPNAPGKFCYQSIKFCIRYTFTDCKCNTCDTVICYTVNRKWSPFHLDGQLEIIKRQETPTSKSADSDPKLQGAASEFATITMSSSNKGKLTIVNPAEDEYTSGVTLQSILISTSPGVRVLKMTPDQPGWSTSTSSEEGVLTDGLLAPGKTLNIDIEYDNSESFKTWVNTLTFKYIIDGIPDTLSGITTIVVRTPGSVGGDILSNDNSGGKVANARTFALWFKNANVTGDSIAKVVLKLQKGSLLAVGPNTDHSTVSLSGYSASGNQVLLASTPDAGTAILSAVSPGTNIGPIYLTVASDDPELIVLNYKTLTSADDIVTEGTVELASPVAGVYPGDPGAEVTTINLSDAQPNPADGSTLIRFVLSSDEPSVSLIVTNTRGEKAAVLIDGSPMNAGAHEVVFKTASLPNGVYFYTLRTGNSTQTRKLVIQR